MLCFFSLLLCSWCGLACGKVVNALNSDFFFLFLYGNLAFVNALNRR